MLSKYQSDVIEYFRYHAHAFVQFMAKESIPIVVYGELLPSFVKFLDRTLKLEIDLYDAGSFGYHKLQDMLIEIHVAKPEGLLHRGLCDELTSIFRMGQVEA